MLATEMQLVVVLLGDELARKKKVSNMFNQTLESTLKKRMVLVKICGQGEALEEVRCGQKIGKVSGKWRVGQRIQMMELAVRMHSMKARFLLSVQHLDCKFSKHLRAAAVLKT
jgi:hypothetical protein